MIPTSLKDAQLLIKTISKDNFRKKIVPIAQSQAFANLAGGGHDKNDRHEVSNMLAQTELDNIECNPAAVHWYVRAITSRIVCEHWHI